MASVHYISFVLFVFSLIICDRQVAPFPEGAPEEACRTMIPNHSTNKPQTGPAPFTITTDQSVYVAGDSIKGKLRSLVQRISLALSFFLSVYVYLSVVNVTLLLCNVLCNVR